MTIHSYVKQQGELLEVEAEARAKAREDAQRLDAKVRDTYTQLVRRSVYDLGTAQIGSDDGMGGIRIQPPRSSGVWDHSAPKEDLRHKRDVTLLENGMIKERVDVKREEREEEKRRRRGEKNTRKISGTETSSVLNPPSQYFAPPTSSPYDPAYADPNHGAAFAGAPRQHRSPQPLYPYMSSPSVSSLPPRPFSMVMSGTAGSMSRAVNQSQTSVDARSTRFFGTFFGAKNAWGSGTSVAPSGSVMDMQYVHPAPNPVTILTICWDSLALDQERRQQRNLETASQFDLPSSFSVPNSPRQGRPHTADAAMSFTAVTRSLSPESTKGKKKKRGFGKLWRMMRGSKDEGRGAPAGYKSEPPQRLQQEEDVAPLVPPPSLRDLVNHRAGSGGQQRQISTPSLSGNHPRSLSQPAPGTGSNGATSPTTAPSSALDSPTSNRLQWRDSGSDDRRSVIQKDGCDQVPALQVDGNGLHDPAMLRQSQAFPATDDPKRTLQVPSSGNPTPTGVLTSTTPASTIGPSSPPPTIMAPHNQQRPLSAMIHKSLPPIPPGETPVSNPAVPMSSASLPPNFGTPEPDFLPNGNQSSQNLGLPNAPFRTQGHEGRRQSFGGVTSRPEVQLNSPPLGAQTVQPQRPYQQNGNGAVFDEMGYLANGGLPSVKSQRSSPQLRPVATPKSDKGTKRRSRFGLSSLLGKKDKDRDNVRNNDFASQGQWPLSPSVHSQPLSSGDYHYQTLRNPSSDGNGYTNGLAVPVRPFNQTRGSGSSSSLVDQESAMGRPPSMFLSSPSGENVPRGLGVAGRQHSHTSSMTYKRVEDLVVRDDDFVAYRYPSTDQQLDLPRR
jgi:hypothetical protein